jgi:hypothetical protein
MSKETYAFSHANSCLAAAAAADSDVGVVVFESVRKEAYVL